MNRIIKFVILDILKNKIVLAYTIILGILSWSAFSLEDNVTKGLLTLLNIVLLTVPLVAVMFSTIYIYNSAEFIELLLSQPVQRKKIWMSLFFGLVISMVLAYLLGAGIPLLLFAPDKVGMLMLVSGCVISAVFVSIAFFSSILSRDKSRGIGISIMLWLYFALLFDGLVLFLLFQFSDYPIERLMIGITAFSPVDLTRILILLQLDASAMMGYTGALFREFFGSPGGMAVAMALLFLWIALPFSISLRLFRRMDL